MSAQAGVFYTDRRPIPPEVAQRIDAALADFGPDGGGSRLEPGLLMLSRALHITPEDEREEQPLVSPAGRVLTWDGRLDNRDDLLLQFHRELGVEATDGALALAAFERWGVDGFARLIGDWSLALWDAPERRLVLASDYMGVRPLYYRRAPDHVAWSSSLGELVLREGVKDDLDDVFVVGFLVGFVPADRTPYLPIRSVTPAHVLSFSAAGTTRHRFYEYPANTIRYRHTWEYEEHFREVFAKAVGARLRSTRPVWAELSGGLDSSSVVCMADWLSRSHHCAKTTTAIPPLLRTLSFISNGSPEVDERRFIAEVEAQCLCESHRLNADEHVRLHDDMRQWVTPRHPSEVWLAGLLHVGSHGGRTLLTGQGGDLVTANEVDWSHTLVELLLDRRFIAFFTEGHAWALAARKPIVHVLWRLLIADSLGSALRALRLRDPSNDPPLRALGANDIGSLVASAPLEQVLQSHRDERRAIDRIPTPRRQTIAALHRFALARVMQTPSDLPGLVLTHPFFDRRVVSSVLAMPQRVLNRPGQTRALMRRAFADLLPPLVLNRFSKGYVAPFHHRATVAQLRGLRSHVSDMEVVQRGWVSADGVRQLSESVRARHHHAATALRSLLSVELWMTERRMAPKVTARSTQSCLAGQIPHERR
jgi:asparagine synthase (glutamine-hydrolysing)